MARFADVAHHEWIAAPVATVCAQFADLQHHIDANVHPKLRFRVLDARGRVTRFEQQVKLLGITQRDVFERVVEPDGTIVDTSVEGFNKGGSLEFRFVPEEHEGRAGTRVDIRIRLPLPPVIGGMLRRPLEAQVRREVRDAAAEDKRDIEQRGYRAAPMTLRVAA